MVARKVIVNLGHEYRDYPTVGYTIPAFSQRAVDGLRGFLEPNGELLPLEVPEGVEPYWAYNLTKILPVLDEKNSKLDLYKGSDFAARKVLHHEFLPNLLTDLSIFRIRNVPEVYVTDTFVRRVEELGSLDTPE